jgi:NAD(P)-dependent dehydrogenase (short-subunit alcohol dehydrogenase family)
MEALENQIVLVVGASSGMGRATAIKAASEGAFVHLIARSEPALGEVAREIGKRATFAAADMTDAAAVRGAVRSLIRIDHLAISAVADELKRKTNIETATPEQVERSFDRLRGYIHCIQAVLPKFNKRGSISLWCGASALRPPRQGFSLLSAENASVTGFGRALALELAPIRVNVLMAGLVDTPIVASRRDEVDRWAQQTLPVAHLGRTGDLAHAALFLMTNPYLTGQTIIVDGGFTLV